MNRRKSNSLNIRLFVLIVTLALVGAELIVTAQNSNSSTTMQNDNMAGNTNMGGTTRRTSRRRRRGRRRSMSMSNANAACGPMQENANMAGSMQENANSAGAMTGNASTGGRRRRGRRVVGFPAGQTSTDLQNAELERTVGKPEDFTGQSYTGTVNYPEGNLSGPAKLEFMADNQFSLTPEGGQAITGRYTAVTTRGYTGVTMVLGTASSQTTPATIISVRLKKVGNSVQIMSVPGEKREFSFTENGNGRGGKSRGHRRPIKVAIKPPTVANRMQSAY